MTIEEVVNWGWAEHITRHETHENDKSPEENLVPKSTVFPYAIIAHHISWQGNNISMRLRTVAKEYHKAHHRGKHGSSEFNSVPPLMHQEEHRHEHGKY